MNLAEQTVSELRLDPAEQLRMVAEVREICRASPLVRPRTPGGLGMRVRVTAAGRLGWVGDGAYRYSEVDSRGKPWPPMPMWWRELADEVTGSLWMERPAPGPAHFPWDCAIINWYEPGASLGWHQDRSEVDLSLPIVTFSLGDDARWSVKAERDGPASSVRLTSGAITVLAGDLRSAWHSIERVYKRGPEVDQAGLFGDAPTPRVLAKPGRVSVTLRVAGGAG